MSIYNRPTLLFLISTFLALPGCSVSNNNAQPVATDSCTNTPASQVYNGDLNNYVTDPDDTVFNFTLQSPGTQGVAFIDPAGTFSYTPNSNARGVDSFTYIVDDLDGGQDTATVTVIIDTRIMPLGDSITAGITDGAADTPFSPVRVGYRQDLYTSLVAAAYPIDFVGGFSEGDSAGGPPFDTNHEGHPGDTSADVAANITLWLNNNPTDVILLHIGTNPPTINISATPVSDILDAIDTWETANSNPITVFLARIIDRDAIDADVEFFNNNVETMAMFRAADDIVMVNQHDALIYPGDLADDTLNPKLHPNAAGYGRMATAWMTALTGSGVLPKCP